MKFNWKWFSGVSVLLTIAIAGIIMLFNIHNYGSVVIGGYVFVGLITGLCLLCVYLNISDGEAYYQYFTLPKDQWNISLYQNMIILSRHNLAWSYTHRVDDINKLDEIKSVQYYNIWKKTIKWYPIPYQQLDENKAAELTVKRAAKKARKKEAKMK